MTKKDQWSPQNTHRKFKLFVLAAKVNLMIARRRNALLWVVARHACLIDLSLEICYFDESEDLPHSLLIKLIFFYYNEGRRR